MGLKSFSTFCYLPASNNIHIEGHARSLESANTTPDRAQALSRVNANVPMTREIQSVSYCTLNTRQFFHTSAQ